MSRMAQLGFRADIAAVLQELDSKVLGATTPLDFKSCMEAMRTVYEEIVEDAAKASGYARRRRQRRTSSRGTTGSSASASSRRMKASCPRSSTTTSRTPGRTAPEQLRVTKNMVIELGLLIVGRVQALGASTSGGV
jgi:hypothetical protein